MAATTTTVKLTELEEYNTKLSHDKYALQLKYYTVKFWCKLAKTFGRRMDDEYVGKIFEKFKVHRPKNFDVDVSTALLIQCNISPRSVCDAIASEGTCNVSRLRCTANKIDTYREAEASPVVKEEEEEGEKELISFGQLIDDVLDVHDVSEEDRAILWELGLSEDNLPFLVISDMKPLSITTLDKRRLCFDLVSACRTDVVHDPDIWDF